MKYEKILLKYEMPQVGQKVIMGEDEDDNIQIGYINEYGKLEVCENEDWDISFFEWWLKEI